MLLRILKDDFSIVKLNNIHDVPLDRLYVFAARTAAEISLVCKSEDIPVNHLAVSHGWRGFYFDGVLDFSLTGILANIADILAKASISIFAVSTFDTDYIFVRQPQFQSAYTTLKEYGYNFIKE